tara:strand:+ start:1701 stop:2144 length:444 start_codon:yes stop_codon:yes gene_type:complete
MANSLENSYSDPRYGVKQNLRLPDTGANQTSVIAADTVIARVTVFENILVKDWNCIAVVGATQTGTAASARNYVEVGKSLGGTGTVAPFGSAFIGGTIADNTVIDSTATETTFVAGDDIVLQYAAATGLAASAFRAGGLVSYVENFV